LKDEEREKEEKEEEEKEQFLKRERIVNVYWIALVCSSKFNLFIILYFYTYTQIKININNE